MPYEPIPYAPDEVYSSRDYTRQQMALLQQQADREAAYAQRRGALMADRWKGLGGLATETLASLVQSRDLRDAKAEAQRRYDAEQAEEKRRYDLVERRAAAQEAQQALDRKKADDQFDYAQIMGLSPNTPLSQSQLDTLQRVNPGAMAPLTRERDQFVAREAPAPASTEDVFANTMRRGLTGAPREPAAPLFGGGLGTERVTEQYGVGRRRTAVEEEQFSDNLFRQEAARAAARQLGLTNERADEAAARAEEAARLAASRDARTIARQTDIDARLVRSEERADRRLGIQENQLGKTVDARSQTQFNAIASQYTKDPIVAAADRTYVLRDTAKAILAETKETANPPRQLRLAYAYVGAIDNYLSTVRESELANLGQLDTRVNQYKVELNRIASKGGFLSADNAKAIARDALELGDLLEQSRQRKGREYSARARVTNSAVGDMFKDYLTEIAAPNDEPEPPPTVDLRDVLDKSRNRNFPLTTLGGNQPRPGARQ